MPGLQEGVITVMTPRGASVFTAVTQVSRRQNVEYLNANESADSVSSLRKPNPESMLGPVTWVTTHLVYSTACRRESRVIRYLHFMFLTCT